MDTVVEVQRYWKAQSMPIEMPQQGQYNFKARVDEDRRARSTGFACHQKSSFGNDDRDCSSFYRSKRRSKVLDQTFTTIETALEDKPKEVVKMKSEPQFVKEQHFTETILCELQEQVCKVEKQLKHITDRIAQRDQEKCISMIGQLPSEIEGEIVQKVLSKYTIPQEEHCIYRIKDMEEALEGGDDEVFDTQDGAIEKNRQNARDAWIALKQRLNWSDRHYGYMKAVKRLRKCVTNREFNLEEVERAVNESTNEEVKGNKEACKELIQIYKQLVH